MNYEEKLFGLNVEKTVNKFRSILLENQYAQFFTKYFLLFALILVLGIIGILNPNFLNAYNIMNVLKTTSVVGLIAIAAMINLNSGILNFCLGMQSTLTAVVIVSLLQHYTEHYWMAVLAGFAASMIVGLICYFFVVALRVSSVLATLSLSSIVFVIVQGLTGGSELFSNNWPAGYTYIGKTKLFGALPLPVIIFFSLGAGCWFVMERTRLGRRMYACGISSTTSKHIGIAIGKMKLAALMIGSLLVATAGLIESSILNSVSPNAGNDLLIPAISSAMLSVTFLSPGKYNVLGTMIAVFLTTCIKIGVAGLGAGSFVSDIVQGIILLIAVGFITLVREEGLPKVGLT